MSQPNATRVAVLTKTGVFRVHAKDCRDLTRASGHQQAPFQVAGQTRAEISQELHEDFIEEGSMSPGEALDYVIFLPCSGL